MDRLHAWDQPAFYPFIFSRDYNYYYKTIATLSVRYLAISNGLPPLQIHKLFSLHWQRHLLPGLINSSDPCNHF